MKIISMVKKFIKLSVACSQKRVMKSVIISNTASHILTIIIFDCYFNILDPVTYVTSVDKNYERFIRFNRRIVIHDDR